MAIHNNRNATWHLRTLFNEGAMSTPTDGQLLERFATGCGEPRELAFTALVNRHGPFVLRVCRAVLRDEDAAEEAFQATFLALARKAGSLWVQGSLAPWLHQAAYRAAIHERSATIRRRTHEHAAAALRPEPVVSPYHGNDDDTEKIIHEEIDRLPGRFRVAVVLCDLEGRSHEQAARHLGCAVGTVKSRLARGRKRLRGRLVLRGVAPMAALTALSAASAARAVVPTGLAESTVVYAATASAVPAPVAIITEGVLTSMFLRKVKLVMAAVVVVVALAAGAVALAQSGLGRSRAGAGSPQRAGADSWTYQILVSHNGEPPRKVAVVEMSGDTPIRVDAPGAIILFQPKRDGHPDRQDGMQGRDGDIQGEATSEKTSRVPTDTASNRPPNRVGPASRNPTTANHLGAYASQSENDQNRGKIVLTSPKTMDVTITQRYVCQIHSQHHINIRATENGFLQDVNLRVGQAVKTGDLMFKIVANRSKAKLDAELAELRIAELEYGNTEKLHKEKGVVSENEVRLSKARLDRAKAKADLARAEFNACEVRAPFDGIVDRMHEQQGSLLKEGDILTTLSDNRVMWVYFNVPMNQYLEYMATTRQQHEEDPKVELVLANGSLFPHRGKIGAIDAQFNNATGTISFRADFPNPDGLLRHGQTGTILIRRKMHDSTVIPLRSTFEVQNKRYVYVVDNDDVVHQREIVSQRETDDLLVIKKGVNASDRIIVDGVRRVRDGEKVDSEFRPLEQVIGGLKDHPE